MNKPHPRIRDYLLPVIVAIGYILLIVAVRYTESQGDYSPAPRGTPTYWPPSQPHWRDDPHRHLS